MGEESKLPNDEHLDDPCPSCYEADLEKRGGKEVCPACNYIQPCCQP